MKSKELIILSVIVIICVAIVCGAFIITNLQPQQQDTELRVLSDESLYNGDDVIVKLITQNETPVANQSVNITIIDDNGKRNTVSLITNESGIATFELSDLTAGSYTLEIVFGGSDLYKPSNDTFSQEIKEEVKVHTLADHPPKKTQAWFDDVWSSHKYDSDHSLVTYRDGCVEIVPNYLMPY